VRITLKRKISALAAGAAVLPLLVTLTYVLQFQTSVATKAEQALKGMARANIGQVARDVYSLCEMADTLLRERMSRHMTSSRQIFLRRRIIASPETTTWQVEGQEGQRVSSVTLPKLMVGDQWLGNSRSLNVPTPFVDEVKSATGVDSSVFQRMNEQGDMMRVATTATDRRGQRALGTYIPAVGLDGSPSPVIESILRGKPFQGHSNVLGTTFVTAFEPFTDPGGKVLGMLAVGESVNSLESLRRAILSMRVGQTGYVAVIGAKGEQRGRYIISQDGKRDGESILDAKDSGGNYIIQNQISQALAQPRGQTLFDNYSWQNPGESAPRRKIAALIYFEPWDWLINAGTYEDEYYEASRTVRDAITGLMRQLTVAGVAALALALAGAFLISSRLTKPITVTARVAQRIASGDVAEAKRQLAAASPDGHGEGRAGFDVADEMSELLEGFEVMAASLDALIGQVHRSGIQVNTSTTQIAAAAHELEAAVAQQASSILEVTATSKQIAATSGDLLATMGTVSQAVSRAGASAEAGHGELNRMGTAVRQLIQATGSVSSRLGVMSDRAGKISTVVTTINKISDQTALLSLNAAIEAEKAGEYGKGFSVVAREIRRLADQTAAATDEIESVVREMQSSVSGGVMEMDKFSEEVRRRVDEVASVAKQFGTIIDHVQALGPQFQNVNAGMQAQTEGAQQISEAMVQLSQAADRTRESLTDFKQVAVQLRGAVQALQGEVSRFKISA